MLAFLKLIERGLNAVVRPAAFLALAAMLVVVTLQIIFRMTFDALSWSEEAARYLLVWSTFLGATVAWQLGRHIAVTALIDLLPAALARTGRILSHASCLVFFVLAVNAGWHYMAMQGFQVSASMRIPMPWVYAIIPVTSAIMAFYSMVDLLEALTGREPEVDDAIDTDTEPHT